MKKILIGMSGGVDSAVAALLLRDKFDVTGLTMRLWSENEKLPDSEVCTSDENATEAKKIADILGIEHITLSLGESFRENVVNDFICQYRAGKTPNPCVECNRTIKFGKMFDIADARGFDMLATGHYAKIIRTPSGECELRRASDTSKDQSYFLWSIKKERLASILFPLGDYTKAEIRELAASQGFTNAHRSDSQDICFIPDGNYAAFIEKYDSPCFKQGNFVDTNGKLLGSHSGLERYTIGQRKGLGIALGQPMFVGQKDAESGNVTLCSDAELYSKELTASSLNILANTSFEAPTRVEAKIRYRHAPAPATVLRVAENTLTLVFDEPQRAICSGQSLVLYDGDTVLGGGIID